MARPMQQTINCPSCGQRFNAVIEQIIDTGADPTAKERLLSGRVNLVSCPHCGFQGMISTPLMYHDPDKQLAIVHVPMELNLQQEDRERMIGDMTNAVMRAMPEDAPKGYLLQPSTALTLQGLIDQVLEAEGITPEMIDAERRMVELIDRIAQAETAEVDELLEENHDLIDTTFLQLLTAAAQSYSQNGQSRIALRLLNTRAKLMEMTEAGRELKAQEDALQEASQELQALGERPTREQFVDLLVAAAGNPYKVEALGVLGRALLDYTTFQMLTERIEQASGEEAGQLEEARERLRQISEELERQSRAAIEQAQRTLRKLLKAPDLDEAIVANSARIDDTFLFVLRSELEAARQNGQLEASTKLKQIRDRVMELIEESSAIQLIQVLLSAPSDEEAIDLLRQQGGLLSPEFVAQLEEIVGQLRQAGHDQQANRLAAVRDAIPDIVRESAPPEIALINDLLAAESDERRAALLEERSADLSPEFMELVTELARQLRAEGNEDIAGRLEAIRAEAQAHI